MKSFFGRCRVPMAAPVLLAMLFVAWSTPSAVAQASARAGHRGGVLTIAVGTEPATLNHDVTDNPSITPVQTLVQTMLVVENAKQEIVPQLATSWKESANGLTYTIYLRHGVRWSDGVSFTSRDVVFSLEKFPPISPSISRTFPKVVKSVQPRGAYEVVIQLRHAYAPFLTLLAETFFMEPAHIFGNETVLKDSQANDHLIGTGPFLEKQWIPTQKVVLVRNPHYWGATTKGLPLIKEVVVDVISNPQTIVDGLLNGSIDYVPTSFIPLTAITQVQHSSCCRAVPVAGTPAFEVMYTNTARPPFNNLTVRRAVYMAITRKLVVQDGLSGRGTLPRAPIPPSYGQLYTSKINLMKQYPYDPAKAAKMLDSAGFPATNGERFGKAVTLLYSGSAEGGETIETAKLVKAELAKITIKVNLVDLEITSWATQTYLKKDFTLSLIGLTSSNDPALGGIQRTFACQPPTPTVEFTNPTGFCSKKVTALFHDALIAPTAAKRKQDYAKAQIVIDKSLPSYVLSWTLTYVGISKRVQNWKTALLARGGNFNATWLHSWIK